MLRLVTLGACYLERHGERLETASAHRKALALLALVTAAGERGISRDVAVALLWPDSSEERARTSLRQLIHSLRTRLDAPNLLLSSPELRFDPQIITSDVAEFRAALDAGDPAAAVAHYRGAFLDGFYLKGAGELERWIAHERMLLEQTAARAFEQLALAAEQQGDLGGAVGWWRRLAALEPLSSRAAIGLMRALDASGERSAALQHARVYEMMVAGEFGDVPDAAVSTFAAELRSGSPTREPVAVRRAAEPETAAAATAEPGSPDAATVADMPPRAPPRVWILLSLTAVLLAAIGLVLVGRPGPAPPPEASVAVLPLVNTSGNPLDEAISDGLTDNLISALSAVPGLRVIGRTSAFAFKNLAMDLRVIAETLGVSTVLEGSVRRSDQLLKVNVQLVNAADARVLWSGTYDRELQDLFAVEDEIAAAVVEALTGRLTTTPPRRVQNVEAYEHYLRGRHIFMARTNREAIDLAERHFVEALQHDSTLAEAHAGLSDVYTRRAVFGFAPARESYARAMTAARRALELDSTLAGAHTSLGHALCVADFDWQGAEQAFRRAVALEPGYTFGRLPFAVCLWSRGRFEEAEQQLDIARGGDPLAPAISNLAGRLYVAWRKPDEALMHLEQALELSPQMDLAWQQLGHAYLQKGMPAEAIEAMQRAAALSGARDSLHLAYAYAVAGQSLEATHILDSVLASPDPDRLAFHIALAYSGLGNRDLAFAWLERGLEQAGSFMGSAFVEPGFEPLHTDPRWANLLRALGLGG